MDNLYFGTKEDLGGGAYRITRKAVKPCRFCGSPVHLRTHYQEYVAKSGEKRTEMEWINTKCSSAQCFTAIIYKNGIFQIKENGKYLKGKHLVDLARKLNSSVNIKWDSSRI